MFLWLLQVTGRVVRTGEVRDIPDILALPEMTSPARNPRFTYRLLINQNGQPMDNSATLLLRIYTVTSDTKELVVVGSCVFDLFDPDKVLPQYIHSCWAKSLALSTFACVCDFYYLDFFAFNWKKVLPVCSWLLLPTSISAVYFIRALSNFRIFHCAECNGLSSGPLGRMDLDWFCSVDCDLKILFLLISDHQFWCLWRCNRNSAIEVSSSLRYSVACYVTVDYSMK